MPSKVEGLSKFSAHNVTYGDFRKTLQPSYLKNSFPILSTHFLLILCLILSANIKEMGILQFVCIASLSVIGGLLAHRILLLVHEGAHFHLAQNRKVNDFLANTLCGVFVATEVKTYRKIHNKHHQDLGQSTDPENSYSEEFDFTWIFAAFSGLKVLRTFKKRDVIEPSRGQFTVMVLSISLHLVLLASMIQLELIYSTVFWILGFFVVMPGIAALRNVLEHRFEMPSEANPELWGTLDPGMHVTTRLFTRKRVSGLLGSVGFDRHLLHHWDPSISSTNLPAVHKFILTTELGGVLRNIPTTYTQAFIHLMRKNA